MPMHSAQKKSPLGKCEAGKIRNIEGTIKAYNSGKKVQAAKYCGYPVDACK